MNSRRFHQAWDEEISSWKRRNAGWRMQEAALWLGNFATGWRKFRNDSENFAIIAKFSQS